MGNVAIAEDNLVRLSAALDELAAREPRLAEVVDLKYFCWGQALPLASGDFAAARRASAAHPRTYTSARSAGR
jgi:hypothetical protein